MQRTQRSKAGNIYKQRLEEIQMEVPKSKRSHKVTTKHSLTKRVKKGTKPRRSTSGSHNRNEFDSDESDEFMDLDDTPEEHPVTEEESDHSDAGPASRSQASASSSLSPSGARASVRVQKNLLQKYKCPLCKATFAEERYVEFHCKEVHKSTYEAAKETVGEDKLTKRQSSLEVKGHGVLEPDSASEEEPAEPEFEMMGAGVAGAYEEGEDAEDYYDTVQNGELTMYKCRNCADFQVTSKHVIVTHIQRHMSSNYRCPYCRYKASNRASLEVHIFHHTGVKPFCCKVCDLSFKCMDDMLDHWNSGHSQSEIQTMSSGGTEKSKSTGRTRGGRGHSEGPLSQTAQYKCPYCSERFVSVVNLKTHVNIHRLKGLTDEVKDVDLSVLDMDDSDSFTDDYRPPPPTTRIKRATESHLPKVSKRAKLESERIELEQEEVKRNLSSEGPPRCKLCSKVFLYTTQIDKHMRDVHNIPLPELVKPTRFISDTSGRIESQSPDRTPIITSVVSQAKIGTRTVAGTPNGSDRNQSPNSKQIVQKTDASGKPLKSVYLLFDRSNNTCFPVDTSAIAFKGGAEGSSGNKPLMKSPALDQTDPSEPLEEAEIDDRLEEELLKIGKAGTPLIHGADNQNLLHECSVCQEKLVGYIEIVKHFHTHTVGPESRCHLCSNRYSSKASLGVHFLTHLGITFSCPLCQKKLAKKQSLLEHIRYHRGERRFVCNVCEKGFITTSSLNRHMRMHAESEVRSDYVDTAQLEFQCLQCPRSFANQEMLANHEQAHDRLRLKPRPKPKPQLTIPISCQYCSKLWASVLGLARHLKAAHADCLAQAPPSLASRPALKNAEISKPTQVPEEVEAEEVSEVIVTEAEESSTMKIIDIIDLSDEEGGQDKGHVNGDKLESADSGIALGTIVNVDGQDVDAIEVLTSDMDTLESSPKTAEEETPGNESGDSGTQLQAEEDESPATEGDAEEESAGNASDSAEDAAAEASP